MIEPNKLNPFKHFCMTIGALPSSYMESMSYYEMLEWLCNYLQNTVVPAVNNNANALKELQDYVEHYFDNLDIQQEINDKLDEMAESGELTDIIAQYLQLAGLLCYNTKADMKSATNLVNGSFAKTYGDLTYNDGKGNFYKIRNIVNTDVIDDINIIALYDENLVAELIKDDNKKTELVVFGDSWTDPDIAAAVWSQRVASVMGLNLHNYAKNGAGFVKPNNNIIDTQVTTFLNDTTFNKNNIKHIIFMGGLNDYRSSVTASDLSQAIISCVTRIKNVLPNVPILYISNSQYPFSTSQTTYWSALHRILSTDLSIATYNTDCEFGYALWNTSNWFHLTSTGEYFMAKNIVCLLEGGKTTSYLDTRTFEDTNVRLTYTTTKLDNKISIAINLTPKVANANFALNVDQSEPNLSYSATYGMLANMLIDNVTIQYIIYNKQIAFAASGNLTVGHNYYLRFDDNIL